MANVDGNWPMAVLRDLNETAISLEEAKETVNEMKSGKAPGLVGFPVEFLKKGCMAVQERLAKQLDVSFDIRVVPMDCVVHI